MRARVRVGVARPTPISLTVNLPWPVSAGSVNAKLSKSTGTISLVLPKAQEWPQDWTAPGVVQQVRGSGRDTVPRSCDHAVSQRDHGLELPRAAVTEATRDFLDQSTVGGSHSPLAPSGCHVLVCLRWVLLASGGRIIRVCGVGGMSGLLLSHTTMV